MAKRGGGRSTARAIGRCGIGVVLVAGLLVTRAAGSGAAPAATTVTFSYTGAPQFFTVPDGVTSVTIEAIGAAGGPGVAGHTTRLGRVIALAGYKGGAGALAIQVVAVTPGQVLQVNVGGAGGAAAITSPPDGPYDQPPTVAPGAAGWNGGGAGGQFVDNLLEYPWNTCFTWGGGGGGGGASDVRTGAYGLGDRVVVGAGGGGTSGWGIFDQAGIVQNAELVAGGGGGGLAGAAGGAPGTPGFPGQGGLTTMGGYLGGGLGIGGSEDGYEGSTDPDCQAFGPGGGGGGYYGGGAGMGGGGGSSFPAETAFPGASTGNGTIAITFGSDGLGAPAPESSGPTTTAPGTLDLTSTTPVASSVAAEPRFTG